MRTTPEAYSQLLANQRQAHKQSVLDRVPTAAEVLLIQLQDAGIAAVPEFHFHPRRQYRADLFVPPSLLVEIDGSGTGGHPGAHRSLQGYEQDRERDWEALMLGYTVLRVVPRQVINGKAIIWITQLVSHLTLTKK